MAERELHLVTGAFGFSGLPVLAASGITRRKDGGAMKLSSVVVSCVLTAFAVLAAGCCEAEVEVTNSGTMTHAVMFEDNGERSFAPGETYVWTLTWREEAPGDTGTQIPYFVDGADCGTYHIWDGETDRSLDIDDGYVSRMCSD
jgi:hypothetical protein